MRGWQWLCERSVMVLQEVHDDSTWGLWWFSEGFTTVLQEVFQRFMMAQRGPWWFCERSTMVLKRYVRDPWWLYKRYLRGLQRFHKRFTMVQWEVHNCYLQQVCKRFMWWFHESSKMALQEVCERIIMVPWEICNSSARGPQWFYNRCCEMSIMVPWEGHNGLCERSALVLQGLLMFYEGSWMEPWRVCEGSVLVSQCFYRVIHYTHSLYPLTATIHQPSICLLACLSI